MYYYSNGRLKRVKGGYIVECDKRIVSKDSYEGMSWAGTKEEVFEDSEAALNRLDEIYMSEGKMDAVKAKMKKKSDSSDESY